MECNSAFKGLIPVCSYTSGFNMRFIVFLNRDTCGVMCIGEMCITECPSAGFIWWIMCEKGNW